MPSGTDTTQRNSERLSAYWAEALGGPTTYSEAYGDEALCVNLS